MHTERVAVSLVVWRSPDAHVRTTLASLQSSVLTPAAVRVHINGEDESELDRRAMTDAFADGNVVVASSKANVGFARAHNEGLAALFSDETIGYVLVLNPDVRLEPSAISQLVDFAAQHEEPVLVGPLLELACGDNLESEGMVDSAGIRWNWAGRHFDTLQFAPVAKAPCTPQVVDGISGACLLVPRRTYDLICRRCGEFFDNDFFAYREDAELGLRAAALGVVSWTVPASRGFHGRALRGHSRGGSAHIDRLGVRNRFLIAFKYGTHRPGGWFGAPLRDLIVLVGVVLHERSSWRGVAEAWALRSRMHEKRTRLMAVAAK